MRNFNLIALMFLLLAFAFISGCDHYTEVGLGEGAVIRKGAFIRSEGGGVQDEVVMSGTWSISGPGIDAETFHLSYTPRCICLQNMPIVMDKMEKQQLKFDCCLGFMILPDKLSTVFKEFKSYNEEITTIFRTCCLSKLSTRDMGLNLDTYQDTSKGEDNGPHNSLNNDDSNFDNREVVAQEILADFEEVFLREYSEYADCFHFIDVSVNNVDFPPEVIKKLEEPVAKLYETEYLRKHQEVLDLEGQIAVAKSNADLAAFSIEAGALTNEVINYKGMELVGDLITDPDLDVTVYIELDENGNIAWFQER